MMWLKACPRCRGDLYDEPGIGPQSAGTYSVTCLQCGYMLTRTQESMLRRKTAELLARSQERASSVA